MTEELIINLESADIYQRETLVLQNVSLKVEKGSFIYLIGKVGSGKSSLIKTFNAELPLISGNLTVAGYDLVKIKRRDIPYFRRKLGVIFQDFKLLMDRTVHDNLEFVLKATGWKDKKAIKSRIAEMLDLVEMGAKQKVMPHELSGGEQQRVVIARALLNDPELILADEPTGNLDPETSTDLLTILKNLNAEGKTIVMATHDYPIIRQFPGRTIVCEEQKLNERSNESENIDFIELLDRS